MNYYYFFKQGGWAGGLTPLNFIDGKATAKYISGCETRIKARTRNEAQIIFWSHTGLKEDGCYRMMETKQYHKTIVKHKYFVESISEI